jgi:hypothetical protein
MKDKLAQQKAKIAALNHELDLDQREIRVRSAAMFTDPTLRTRNGTQWDKDDAQFKSDADAKQKDLDAARQQLEELQEQARKAGIEVQDNNNNNNDKDKDKK